jgi:hypothetical protein
MKGKMAVLALTLVLILGLSSSQVQAVSTPKYLGQGQWLVVIVQSSKSEMIGASFPVTGGITKVGDNYYLFQGYVADTGDNPFVLSGGGAIINNKLILTLGTSQDHSPDTWRDTGVMQVNLDTTAGQNYLNGTFHEVGHDYNTLGGQNPFDQRFTGGTLTLTGGTIILNPGSLAPISSLLLQ